MGARKQGSAGSWAFLLLQDRHGLVTWPWARVACLRVELLGRLEATSADGEVAHCPGPIPSDCPLPAMGAGLRVNPGCVDVRAGRLHLPDGRRIPVRGRLPEPLPPPHDPVIPAIGVLASAVKLLERDCWVTDQGELPAPGERSLQARKHPHLLRVGARYVNTTRLRRIVSEVDRFRFLLDDGTEFHTWFGAARRVARGLGLHSLRDLEPLDPGHRLLFALGLREWAGEVPEELRDDPVAWIANTLWQEPRRRRAADPDEFMERVVRPGLGDTGAGLPEGERRRLACAADTDAWLAGAWDSLQALARNDVEDRPLATFRVVLQALAGELGILSWDDLGWPARGFHRGTGRPEVLVLGESTLVEPGLADLRDRAGVSTLVLGTDPPAAALDAAARSLSWLDVRVVGHCSYRPLGWALADRLAALLADRGVVARVAGHLLRPERLTALERRCLRFREWPVGRLGRGLGKAWEGPAFHSAHLQPPERLAHALEEELSGLEPTSPPEGPLRRPGLMLAQDSLGVRVVPLERVADVRPEALGRLEVTLDDGEVLWCPGPLDPDWRQRRLGEGTHRDLGLPLDAVLGLDSGTHVSHWRLDQGTMPAERTASHSLHAHPHLAQIGFFYLNLQRLRRLRTGVPRRLAELDTGETLPLHARAPKRLMRALGIRSFRTLPGTTRQQEALLRERLRDWAGPLFPEPPRELTREGGATSPRALLANLCWRLVRAGRQGPEALYGRNHRGLLYHPGFALLALAGFREPTRLVAAGGPAWNAWFARERDILHDSHYLLLIQLLTRLVGRDRLFDYEALGFHDPRPERRRLGSRRPDIVVVLEKNGFQPVADALGREFGVTTIVVGGTPRLIATEWLAKDLLRAGVKRVRILTVVDWDPGGHIAGRALGPHLIRFGLQVEEPATHLVTPERFTQRELDLFSFPILQTTAKQRTRLRHWMEGGGGIAGEPRGIRGDFLRPVERILEAAAEVMGC